MEVNGVTIYTLIDMGAQITIISPSFTRQLQLRVSSFDWGNPCRGDRGFTILYSRYVEVNLGIPQLPQYEEMILMLVIPDSQYTYGILIQIGSQVIQKVMQIVNEQNFNELSEAWRNTYISMVMVGQLTLGETA